MTPLEVADSADNAADYVSGEKRHPGMPALLRLCATTIRALELELRAFRARDISALAAERDALRTELARARSEAQRWCEAWAAAQVAADTAPALDRVTELKL